MLRKIAHWILRFGGWTPVGGTPPESKAVIIAAPHTSNWDGFWALTYRVAVDIDVRFFAKDSLFWFPLGTILRALGGIALDRSHPGSAVDQAVEMLEKEERFYFGLAPEGTRRKMPGWKTGFYRIATRAAVPVYLGFIDYSRKRIGIVQKVELSGDRDADLAVIRDYYEGIEGRWPEKASPMVFR